MVYIKMAFTQHHFQLKKFINKYNLNILAINLHNNSPLGPENILLFFFYANAKTSFKVQTFSNYHICEHKTTNLPTPLRVSSQSDIAIAWHA